MAQPDVYRYDQAAGAWRLSANHPAASPIIPRTVRLGNTLVAAGIESDKAMTISTSAVDSLVWTEQPATHLDFVGDSGTPQAAAMAASADRVVVVSPSLLADGSSPVLVGTIQTAGGA